MKDEGKHSEDKELRNISVCEGRERGETGQAQRGGQGGVSEEKSDGSLDFPHFLSATRRLALEVLEVHGLGWEGQAGLETRGRRVKGLSAEEREESGVEDAQSAGRLEKDSRGGREAETRSERGGYGRL